MVFHQPIWKICPSKWVKIFPKDRDEIQQIFENTSQLWIIRCVWPPPSNSHHQDYYIFSGRSQPKPSFPTGILGGGPHPNYTIYPPSPNEAHRLANWVGFVRSSSLKVETNTHQAKLGPQCLPSLKLTIWVLTQKSWGKPPKSSILIGFSIINHPFWETNTSPLKMDGWNTILSYWGPGLFSGGVCC